MADDGTTENKDEKIPDGAELTDEDLKQVSGGIGPTVSAPIRVPLAPKTSLSLGRDVQSGDPHIE